jgi:chromosome partitioning protein
MAKIISFISRKGGTGKTTNAINLATMLHSLGHKVLMVETDTNYTLNTIRKMEIFKSGANENQLFKIIPSEDALVLDNLPAYKSGGYDYIIIDTAGKTTDSSIKKICVNSDLVVIPTSLSQNDLLVTFQTVEDLKHAKDLNHNLKIAILPNRINANMKNKTVTNLLQQLDASILENYVPSKNMFSQCSTILPEKEYLPIVTELLTLMNNN